MESMKNHHLIQNKINLKLLPQEYSGNRQFKNSKVVCTAGFASTFNENLYDVVYASLEKICTTYPFNADYLQVFTCTLNEEFIKFYAIHENCYIIFMLSSEY